MNRTFERTLRAVFSAVLLLATAPVHAQAPDSGSPDLDGLLPPPRDEFVIGIAELSTGQLPRERRFIGATFSRLLYEELRSISSRELTVAEQEAYLELRREQAIVDAAVELTAAVDARDALLFASARNAPADRERTAEARTRVADAREAFDNLSSVRLTATEPVTVPVTFADELENGTLLAPVSFPEETQPAVVELIRIAEDNGLDYLLYGRAEEQAGYVIVDVYGFHRALERQTLLSSTVRLAEEVGQDAGAVADELAGALLGRAWAALRVRTDDPQAAIRVDGELAGLGSVMLRYVDPGTYRILANRAGFAPEMRTVELVPGEETAVEIVFDEPAVRAVTLRSSPTGADVYVDSRWVGRTPLVYEFPQASSVVHMRADGFLESRFVVDDASPSVISRALLSAQIDWTEELREQRDDFYNSFGFFVLSVPVTMLLWGGYQNVLGTRASPDLATIPAEEDRQLVQLGNTLYWSALGGLAINVGLFVNMLFTLFDYVAVGEGAHNQ